jgi:drug/metabolite transporter (DMT)-like permease
MLTIALALAITATVAYHLVTKLMPAGAHPIATLLVAYVFGSLLCAGILLATPSGAGLRGHFAQVNWTAPALAVVVIVIDLAFILLYRSGFPVSLGALVTQASAAIALLALGWLFFKDRLTATHLAGVVLCLAGLWLVNRE